MIPNKNKDILIEKLREGYSIIEACKTSQISKATLYRHLKDPQFKDMFDEAVFMGNAKIDKAKVEVAERNLAEAKKIVLRKRD